MKEVSKEYAVQMHGIVKKFGSFTALDHAELDVKKGTIHAILGENGAGKSTLMNVLYGLYQAEEGKIYLNGKETAIKHTNVAIENHIGMVHQHFMLVENFTVTQNIILGSETKRGFFLDMKKARENVVELVKKYGLEVDPDAKIEDISVGMQQRVEILKALYRGADILILDEPTAVLTPKEIQELIVIMKNLIADGKTIIIITHKLKEIKQSADECTIIRRGKYIDTVKVADVSQTDLASMMVGHSINLHVDKTPAKPGKTVFEIKDLVVKNPRGLEAVRHLNLSIRSGEIVGIAGIDGNGQKELIEAITNLTPCESGTITINGENIANSTPRNTINHRIATIHEDRHKRGLVLDFTCAENGIIEDYMVDPYSKSGILNDGAMHDKIGSLVQQYDVRPAHCADLPVRGLSGGNQQKIIIGREVWSNPDLLIAVQPTRGLDVGAIEYVRKALIQQRDEGKAILLISYELDEVMEVSDTIAVIYDGAISAVFPQGAKDENEIGLLMAGGTAVS